MKTKTFTSAEQQRLKSILERRRKTELEIYQAWWAAQQAEQEALSNAFLSTKAK